jgi:hypothetical protein
LLILYICFGLVRKIDQALQSVAGLLLNFWIPRVKLQVSLCTYSPFCEPCLSLNHICDLFFIGTTLWLQSWPVIAEGVRFLAAWQLEWLPASARASLAVKSVRPVHLFW